MHHRNAIAAEAAANEAAMLLPSTLAMLHDVDLVLSGLPIRFDAEIGAGGGEGHVTVVGLGSPGAAAGKGICYVTHNAAGYGLHDLQRDVSVVRAASLTGLGGPVRELLLGF